MGYTIGQKVVFKQRVDQLIFKVFVKHNNGEYTLVPLGEGALIYHVEEEIKLWEQCCTVRNIGTAYGEQLQEAMIKANDELRKTALYHSEDQHRNFLVWKAYERVQNAFWDHLGETR